MVHVTKIAHGRVAITNVAGARRREYALGRAGLRADNQVIAVEPKLLQRQREERKQRRVVAGSTPDRAGGTGGALTSGATGSPPTTAPPTPGARPRPARPLP